MLLVLIIPMKTVNNRHIVRIDKNQCILIKFRTWNVVQLLETLPSIHKALDHIKVSLDVFTCDINIQKTEAERVEFHPRTQVILF